ncbi:MAG: Capsule polysaccharide export protein [Devosia sp.]|nr:Capsule polysaccharide export protein [Devosia sp.]
MKTPGFAMSLLRLLALMILIPLAACTTQSQPATYDIATKGPYQLDTGDAVRVTVYGDAQLTGIYRVDDSGALSLPLVGPVSVRGETTKAAAGRIGAALANGFMRNPDVAVEVETYRPFFIEGEVTNSGQFTYVYGMTIRAAVATAGGFSESADRGKAIVYRRNGSQMIKGKVGLDFPIFPGDTIVILERWL